MQAQGGNRLVPVEGDWPIRSELERGMHDTGIEGRAARGLVAALERWQIVAWASEVADALDWLRAHDLGDERAGPRSFRGPSVSSLCDSLRAALDSVEIRERPVLERALRESRSVDRDRENRQLDTLGHVPPVRLRKEIERARGEVRRLVEDVGRAPLPGSTVVIMSQRL
jgi:hypothetical protein